MLSFNQFSGIGVGIILLLTSGCWTPHTDYYSRYLTDMGYSYPPAKTNPYPIPVGESLCRSGEWSVNDYLDNGIILGYSDFSAPWTPEIFALELGKRLGATHVILERKYRETKEHDEICTGYNVGVSTSHSTVSGSAYTYGSVSSSNGGYIGSYNQSTYGYGNASTTTTSLIPYNYQVHVSTPIFDHHAIYVRVENNYKGAAQ